MKLTGSCNASKTLNAGDMETSTDCQSEGDIKELPPWAPCAAEDSACRLTEVKKRKKVLSWPSLMRRLSPLSDFSAASEPELKASLFDQPLSIICSDDDTLPRPIQDILAILCLKGPSTEGIFRKAANEKARKELREELSSGGQVELQSLSVHLLAAVFKDFLRGIPRKLLSWDLFEEWMGALEMQDEELRIEALKRVAQKLPRPNLLLLRHLVSVLHLISKNSEVSKMDASNLAICIGPNILTQENDQNLSLEAQRDLNNKVKALVELLIDNCFEVFGEAAPGHCSVASDDSLEHNDSGSDASALQNDSAYDSNDPDADAGSARSSPEPRGPQPVLRAVARLKRGPGEPDRRHSEPILASRREGLEGPGASPTLTRSEHDCSRPRPASPAGSEGAEDPFPEEVFAEAEGKTPRPGGPAPGAPCSGSLDGSPTAPPSSPRRRFFARHQSFTKTDTSKPRREIKKHSMSFSFASPKRGPGQALRSLSAKPKGAPRGAARRDGAKESRLAGRLVQESPPEARGQTAPRCGSRACTLSVEDVFRLVDRRVPGSPPSYEEAVRGQALDLAACGGRTVGSMRARMLSLDAGSAPRLPFPHRRDSGDLSGPEPPGAETEGWERGSAARASVQTIGPATALGTAERQRLRAASESQWACGARRCSRPAFGADPLRGARESYV